MTYTTFATGRGETALCFDSFLFNFVYTTFFVILFCMDMSGMRSDLLARIVSEWRS